MTDANMGTEIGVDLGALHRFGTTVGSYATNVVSTASERLAVVFSDGAEFAIDAPSSDVQDARRTYANCLHAINNQMFSLVEATNALARAATTIAQEYGSTDAAVTEAIAAARASVATPALAQLRGKLAE